MRGGRVIGLLDGKNRLTFNGPFFKRLSDEQHTEVKADKIVIVSKNGSVAQLPVSQLRTIKERVLNMLYKMIEEEKTVVGARKKIEEGAIMLEKDIYWHKKETGLMPHIFKQSPSKRP